MTSEFDQLSQALFRGEVQGLVATLYQNERPPCGLAGWMDWQMHGALSRYLKLGVISGLTGECSYLPFSRHGSTYHILLIGAGYASSPGHRVQIPVESLKVLQKNLQTLKLKKMGLLKTDFGGIEESDLSAHLKGVPLWLA